MCEKCDALLKHIKDMTESCIASAMETAEKTGDYRKAEAIPEKDLPKHINDPFPACLLVAARLAKESMLQPNLINACMSNEEYDYVDYRAIGVNDGMLTALTRLLDVAGLHDESTNASAYIYAD